MQGVEESRLSGPTRAIAGSTVLLMLVVAAAVVGWSIHCFTHYGFVGGLVMMLVGYVVLSVGLLVFGVVARVVAPVVLALGAFARRRR